MEPPEENLFDKYANVTIRKKYKEKHVRDRKYEADELGSFHDKNNVLLHSHKNHVYSNSYRPSWVNIFPKRRRIGFYDFLDTMDKNEMQGKCTATNMLPMYRRGSYDFLKSSFQSTQRTSNISFDDYKFDDRWIDDQVTEESFLAAERLCQSDEEEQTIYSAVFGSSLPNGKSYSFKTNDVNAPLLR